MLLLLVLSIVINIILCNPNIKLQKSLKKDLTKKYVKNFPLKKNILRSSNFRVNTYIASGQQLDKHEKYS